jgi:hypothetical protein
MYCYFKFNKVWVISSSPSWPTDSYKNDSYRWSHKGFFFSKFDEHFPIEDYKANSVNKLNNAEVKCPWPP